MAERRYPTEQFSASNFAACGGSILIQSTLAPLEICLLHRTARDGRDEWVLPKGHKDRGEDVAEAAARETYEETGYPCRLLPLDMTTVATVAGQQTPAVPSLVRRCEKEPFMLTLRRPDDAPVKVIWWFVTVRTGADKVDGTQTANERFESAFYGVDEALKRTTFGTDRELIEAAVELGGAEAEPAFDRAWKEWPERT
ncbi:NUDIX hydrolase domain-like protein [Russula earlei]|uniref:NUDIX hydrolase domain-like protein n=1 Tax=Russula earlei TaxID=71964 RepID=A0ACC0ULP1_9AGAM|nr:NUDIX hydrolase domain-like protein [Russula earlei]